MSKNTATTAPHQDSDIYPAPPQYEAEAGASASAHTPLLSEIPREGDVPDDYKYGVNVAACDISIRMAFIRKVYSILFAQILATTAIATGLYVSPNAQAWVSDHRWTVFVSMFGAIAVMLGLFWKRRSYPLNFYLLALFTGLEAYSIGNLVTFYDPVVVMQALLITLGLFLGLTLFTLQSKYDFSNWGAYLFGGLWVLVITGIIAMFFPYNRTVELVYCGVGALIFSAYIIYDTYIITKKLSPEEYIIGAVSLYLDLINLFITILRLLDSRE